MPILYDHVPIHVLFCEEQRFSHKQNKFLAVRQASPESILLLPGLRKMLIYNIYQTFGVKVNVYPNNNIGFSWIDFKFNNDNIELKWYDW